MTAAASAVTAIASAMTATASAVTAIALAATATASAVTAVALAATAVTLAMTAVASAVTAAALAVTAVASAMAAAPTATPAVTTAMTAVATAATAAPMGVPAAASQRMLDGGGTTPSQYSAEDVAFRSSHDVGSPIRSLEADYHGLHTRCHASQPEGYPKACKTRFRWVANPCRVGLGPTGPATKGFRFCLLHFPSPPSQSSPGARDVSAGAAAPETVERREAASPVGGHRHSGGRGRC
jgi:hypothetical protein